MTDDDLWGEGWDDLGSFGDDEGTEGPSGGSHDPDAAAKLAADGVEMFQTAALELIAAARTLLDTAEELVADPHTIGTAFESLRGIAAEVVRSARPGARPAGKGREEAVVDVETIEVDDA